MNEDEAELVMLPAALAALEAARELTAAPVTAEDTRERLSRVLAALGETRPGAVDAVQP